MTMMTMKRTSLAAVSQSEVGQVEQMYDSRHLTVSVHSAPPPPGAFIAETSFSRAPLHSRLPPMSPHRAAPAGRRQTNPPRSQMNGITDMQLDHQELDNVQVEDAPTERAGPPVEALEGLGPELQEALIVEDLLFVLMASPITRPAREQTDMGSSRASRGNTSNTTPHTRLETTLSDYKGQSLHSARL